MRKLLLILAAIAGYILGARAGRERYDQIAGQAAKVWGNPKVQDRVEEVKAQAPQLAHLVAENAKDVADRAVSAARGHESTDRDGSYSNEAGTLDADGTMHVNEDDLGPGADKLP